MIFPARSRACLLALLAASLGVGAQQARYSEWSYADTQVDLLQLARLAEQGDARAAYLLGTRYASGRGGVRDDSEAVKWFAKAAELDLPEAQFNLGVMYAAGRGTSRDPQLAARWFGLAAAQGYAPAQHALGTLYARGLGVERNEAEAAKWLFQAAEQGEARAQYNLAVLYEFGRGVPVDIEQAKHWYARAAAIGYEPARKRLTGLEQRLEVGDQQTTDKVAAYRTARRLNSSPPSSGRGAQIKSPIIGSARTVNVKPAATAGGRRLPRGRFTVQLSSHRTQADARAFITRHRLSALAYPVRTLVKGKLWYVVVYGGYASMAEAKKTIAELPEKLLKGKPWVRTLEGLRKQLERQ
ncbi:MAG: hypothetical protein GKR94_25165 [Gammaproteobacteria bacterium]|nr:hypothetical protein [Gammaproteobacteria bacterium]